MSVICEMWNMRGEPDYVGVSERRMSQEMVNKTHEKQISRIQQENVTI